jgi:hypothetical protein
LEEVAEVEAEAGEVAEEVEAVVVEEAQVQE